MKKTISTLALAVSCTLAPISAQADDEALRAQAQKVIADTFATMSGNLMRAMAEGGPAKAIPFCHENVKGLAAELQKKHGVRIQRVSHKPRNPANQASPQELKRIETMQEALGAGKPPQAELTKEEDGRRIYYAPIVIPAETCLKCHGDPTNVIAPADLKLIQQLYPQDQATGFHLGDLRGLWKITFEAPTPGKS